MTHHARSSLSAEQVVIIADEFCTQYGTQMHSYSSLVALAAITSARLDGHVIFASPAACANELYRSAVALQPLRNNHELFAAALAEIYLDWCA